MHGSVSEATFVNISVGCDFEGLFLFEEVTAFQDNGDQDGRQLAALLHKSGYAEDYIRSEFKKHTGYSPVDFLAKVRIDYAKKLLDIYGENLPVSRIAELCGFRDAVYFSRRFKQFSGISPAQYRAALHAQKDRVARF